jgi:16S rRNA (uracil1498-N3)-methyltransferase
MHRFFLPASSFSATEVHFPESVSRQIAQVLRLKVETEVTVLDGSGQEYAVRLTSVDAHLCVGMIENNQPCLNEPETQIDLYLCLTQREKFEWILQKCTELGVSRFVPVISSRSLVQEEKDFAKKLERWQKIIQEAAEQSHRARVPEIIPPLHFREALQQAAAAGGCRLIPWEEERSLSLHAALQRHPKEHYAVLIGPEGGFSPEEVERSQAAGFLSVTLGPRILRMETAAMTAVALILYDQGDMDD